MLKVASDHVSLVAARSAVVMRGLINENQGLSTKVASLEGEIESLKRERRIEKIAQDMESKGLNQGLSLDEKIQKLASYPDLDRVEDAVKMASSVGNIRIVGSVSDMPGRGMSAMADFTNFCLGQDSSDDS